MHDFKLFSHYELKASGVVLFELDQDIDCL